MNFLVEKCTEILNKQCLLSERKHLMCVGFDFFTNPSEKQKQKQKPKHATTNIFVLKVFNAGCVPVCFTFRTQTN